jgi:hypothetical protein
MKRRIYLSFVIILVLNLISSYAFAQAVKQKTAKPAVKPAVKQATQTTKTPMPDLVINTKSIVFSDVTPMEGDAVTISAEVMNKGNADVSDDVEVRFIENDPKEGGLQIGSDAAIFGLKAGATKKVQVKWRPPAGESRIFIIVDPDNLIKESNDDNNSVIRNIKGRIWTGPKFTDEQIKQSVKKGLDWLKTQQGEFYVICSNNHDNFLYAAIGYGKCVICGESLKGKEPVRAPEEKMPGSWMAEIGPGLTALVVSAILLAGGDESDPAVQKGLDHLFTKTPAPWKEWTDPYNYAVFILALTSTGNKKEYMDEVEFSIEQLANSQTKEGGWGYGGMAADAAHMQYVIYGLYAAQQWGARIPTEVWTKAITWLTKLQRPDGGWNYNGEGIGPFAVDSYGSMTATAIMGLKAGGLGPSNETTKKGLDWLIKHYSITRNPGSYYWHYYFMLAVQRAMDTPPIQETLGGHDWYHEMANFLVGKQEDDGSWIADTPISATGSNALAQDLSDWGANRGDIMTTAFAVMFLTKAMPKPAKVDVGFGKQSIIFSKNDPTDGEQITIKASIANMTVIPTENVKVSFFDGDPKSAGVPIGTVTISSLLGNETKEISIAWDAKGAGEHKIYVVIDPSGAIDEATKDNNIDFGQVFVGGKATPAIPGITQVSEGVYRLGKADIDLNKKTVTLYGKVNMTAGIIELFACTKIGKVHESALVMDIEPIHLQTALILLGLEFIGGIRYQGDPMTPKGDRVQIWVEWKSGNETKRYRAEDLVYDKPRQSSMPHTDWIFTGSSIKNGFFMSQGTGTLITTYHDPYTILDNPLPEGGDDTVYIVNSQLIPPKGTEIKMIITPAKPI